MAGKGRAEHIWRHELAPLVSGTAGLSPQVVVSKARGDATSRVTSADLNRVCALVALGGDGTVYEMAQGLMDRGDWEAMLKVPLIHLPLGSGNGLAASCGLWTPVTGVHALCKYHVQRLDLCTAIQPGVQAGAPLYSFELLHYGLLANLDFGTEHLRKALGGARFTYGALKEIGNMKRYKARLAYVPAEAKEVPPASTPSPYASKFPTPLLATLPAPLLSSMTSSPADVTLPQLPAPWRLLDEAFFVFSLSNMPWIATDFNFHPAARLDDGCLDLLYNTNCTRGQGLSILLSAEKGEHVSVAGVVHQRVRALAFFPDSGDTFLSLDGEQLPMAPILMEVHQGAARVLVAPQE